MQSLYYALIQFCNLPAKSGSSLFSLLGCRLSWTLGYGSLMPIGRCKLVQRTTGITSATHKDAAKSVMAKQGQWPVTCWNTTKAPGIQRHLQSTPEREKWVKKRDWKKGGTSPVHSQASQTWMEASRWGSRLTFQGRKPIRAAPVSGIQLGRPCCCAWRPQLKGPLLRT